jgi:hypothetical protein
MVGPALAGPTLHPDTTGLELEYFDSPRVRVCCVIG